MNTDTSKIRIYCQPDGELAIDTDKEIYICKNVEVVGINFKCAVWPLIEQRLASGKDVDITIKTKARG